MHVNELLDLVKREFDSVTSEASNFRSHKDEFDRKFNQQSTEMQQIRQTVIDLEKEHRRMKEKYEEEISRLKRELEQAPSGGAGAAASAGAAAPLPGVVPPPGAGAPPPPAGANTAAVAGDQPPSLGRPGGNNVFGGIMTGQGQLQQPVQQSYPQQPPPPPQQQQQPPALSQPPPQSQAPPQQPPSQQQQPPQQFPKEPYVFPEVDKIPPELKKEHEDWYVAYNPQTNRRIDVDLLHTLEHNSVVCCVRFSADGKYVATGCNRSAQIYDVGTGQLIAKLEDESVNDKEGDLYIRAVCFSPDGQYLVTGAEDKLIRVWDIKTRQIRHFFRGHDQDIYSLDFSRNGRHIASGSGDRNVILWDMETGESVLTLSITDGVTTVAISPDGRYVAAGSLDKTVRVWDASTGFLVERLEGHGDSVYSYS